MRRAPAVPRRGAVAPRAGEAVDPVCGMTVAVGPDTPTARRRAFCCEGCREAWLARAGLTPFVAGLVLAAGGSSRLGRPKQLLPYRGATLLDAVLGTARACGFDQLLVALGGRPTRCARRST